MRLETSNEGEGKKSLPRADVAPQATIPANTGGGTLPASPRF
jgi:hypothetical protein